MRKLGISGTRNLIWQSKALIEMVGEILSGTSSLLGGHNKS